MDIITLGFLKNHIGNSVSHKVVDALPPYGEMGVVYFLKKTNGTYTKYMYNDRAWEKIEESSTLSSGSIEVSGAKVGDFLRVKEIDEKGVPTAWETAEIPTGGEWKLLRTVTIPEDVTTDTSGVTWRVNETTGGACFAFDTDENGQSFVYNELYVTYRCGSTNQSSSALSAVLLPTNTPTYNATIAKNFPIVVAKTGSFAQGYALLSRVFDTYCVVLGSCNNAGGTGILTNMYTIRDTFKYQKDVSSIALLDAAGPNPPGFSIGSTFTFYGR